MNNLGFSNISEQAQFDVKTIIKNLDTISPCSHSWIHMIINSLLDSLSCSTIADESGLLSLLKTLHLLLQVHVCDEENRDACNSELAIKSLKISSGFLQKNFNSFDTICATLCNIIYLSLVLMSLEDLAKNAGELILKCEESLSFYLTCENRQVDHFDPEIALQLLTIVLSALCQKETANDAQTDDLSDLKYLKISHDLVIQLALCNNDTLRAQVLITLIPKIVKQEKRSVILTKLLNVIVRSENEESLSRALAALSALSIYYLPDIESNLTCCVEENNVFWILIQRGLCSDIPLLRKHALYLIRRCVSSLSNTEKAVNCDMFFWVSNQKGQLLRWWQDICTVLEVLEERAFHLISPVLGTLQNIFSSCLNEDSASTYSLIWCLTIFRRVLQHSCKYVVKWGVDTLIGDIGCDLISSKLARRFYPFFLETLIHSLNSPQIFYEVEDVPEKDHEIPELGNLEKYFGSASRSEIRQEFFVKLFDVMGTFNWAPISLYIFTKALSRMPSFKCLNPNDTPIMKRVVAKILATQNVSIRVASLEYLLITVINLIDCENSDFKAVLNVLSAFYSDGNLPRNTELWNHTIAWICRTFNENQVVSWMAENASNTDYVSPVFAQSVTLLYDTGFLKSFDLLEDLLSLLSNCDTRLYIDQDAQTRCVEIIAHMVRSSMCSEMCKNQCYDKTRDAVLFVVKATVCNMMKLLKVSLFTVENLTAYCIATKLLKCFELFCRDKDVAFIFSKEKSFTSLMSAALDIVENDFEEKNTNFIFAINVVNFWCKTAQDLPLNYQINERRGKIFGKILELNVLVEAPLTQTSKLPPWTSGILATVSSAVYEAQWDFVASYISQSVTGSMAVQIVEAVGVGLDTGGSNLLPIVFNILRKVLVKYPKSDSPTAVLRNCWSTIHEVRHKDMFYPALREFLSAVFQPDVLQTQWGAEFAWECGDHLISSSESVYGVVGELVLALQNLVHLKPEIVLLDPVRNLVVSCFVLSSIQRRDQKLMRKITSSITSEHNSNSSLQLLRDDPFTFVRCTAIEIFIFLISSHDKWTTEIAGSLTDDLLQQTETGEAKRSRYFSNSLTHRIQLHVLQGLILVEPKTNLGTKEALGKWLLNRLLNENHQLSVRYLTEWLLVRICGSVEDLRKDLLKLVETGDIRESALCSVISTLLHCSHTLKYSRPEENNEDRRIFLTQFFEALLPLTMSQAYNVRFNAHVALLQVWETMENLQLTKEIERYVMSASAVRKSFWHASNKFQNHKDFYLTEFQCVEHFSLETLFYEMARLTHMSRDEWIKPCLLRKIGIGETGLIPLMNKNRRLEEFSSAVDRRREGNATGNLTQSRCVQKKMVPSKWLEVNQLLVKALPEVLRPWKKDGNRDFPSHGLVVVASLLDKASNLGGLSRTCEIMGASLVLPKMSFALDREFQALSMSSEMWAPLSEVKPHELPKFLTEMKNLGFTLIGAEQTAKSTSLINAEFPENTLLLLGNECEGIPSNLLNLLDVCVEIPQYGLVRSLNVHVAGALFIYEYRRQHSAAKLPASFSNISF